ncbi:MAG: cytochrome c biogenesis protein ResB [Bacteroidia bacterium]
MLEEYPGSESPSSYASEVTVIDNKNNKNFNRHIFMNNILDYGGYRFFQSSFDQDERNNPFRESRFWGTWISYLSCLFWL